MALAHLKKGDDGHLLKNAAGHLVNDCGVESGDDCGACDDPTKTPLKRTAVFSGIDHTSCQCSGQLDLLHRTDPNGAYVLTQVSGTPCQWRHNRTGLSDAQYSYSDPTCTLDETHFMNWPQMEYLVTTIPGPWTKCEVWLWDGTWYLEYIFKNLAIAIDCLETGGGNNTITQCFSPQPYYYWKDGSVTISPGGSPFTKTLHCKKQVHCCTCRDLEGGRKWRESLRVSFTLPDGLTDFPCPYGKSWGFTGRELLVIPPEAEALCRICANRSCPNINCIGCEGGVTVNIVVPCPLIPPRWMAVAKEM